MRRVVTALRTVAVQCSRWMDDVTQVSREGQCRRRSFLFPRITYQGGKMQPVVRSTLVGLLTIAGLAACGDKVNVTAPSTPVPSTVVHSVTVTPASASLAIGDKFQFGASVDADQGVTDRTVTWS